MNQHSEEQDAPAEPTPVGYLVTGRQRVHEISPGEVVDLDPEKPETARLLARGQIAHIHQADPGDGPDLDPPNTDDDPDDGHVDENEE